MTSAIPAGDGKPAVPAKRGGIPREGSKPEEFGGLARINMETGEIQHIYKGRAPGNGAVLATAGELVFWGDLDGKFRAFDAASGKILWRFPSGGSTVAGPAIAQGRLYWGSGYNIGTPNNKLYAFCVRDESC